MTNDMSPDETDKSASSVVCSECGARYPADMKNQAFHAIAHGYLFHPPDPTEDGVSAPEDKREMVREARKRYEEAGLYER